jgi:trigger factor
MQITKKDLPQSKVELTIELSVEETQPFLLKAAQNVSQRISIPGFRPGKAPYDRVKQAFGEGALYQEALQTIVSGTYWKALEQENVATVGQPDIQVEKLAPGNPVIYKATATLMPTVTVGDISKIKQAKVVAEVQEEDLDKVLNDFASWRATETAVERAAADKDKVTVDFEVMVDNVVIEGGKADNYPITIGSGAMIPGMEEQLIGMKAGETKEFDLSFPKEYFQANLAGKPAHFKVTLKQVMERKLAEINDEWAQELSGKPLAEWRAELRAGMQEDKQTEAEREWETATIEKIIEASTFSELPELLVKNETGKMLEELRHNVSSRQMKWEDYLSNMKKTEEQLVTDFIPQAEKRVKAALLLRQIAKDQKVTVTPEAIDEELAKQKVQYAGNKQAEEVLASHDYRHYVENTLINGKVMDWIGEQVGKESK